MPDPRMTPARRRWLERLEREEVVFPDITDLDPAVMCREFGWTRSYRNLGQALTPAGREALAKARENDNG